MMAQGYGPTVASRGFSHKAVCDLMGNPFHAVPLMVCLTSVLATLGMGLGKAIQVRETEALHERPIDSD